MTGCLRQQEPPPEEGSRGLVEDKCQGPEPRGGAEREVDRGVTVSLNIIRPAGSEQNFYNRKTALN